MPSRPSETVSLAPLTPEQAMAAGVRVKRSDVEKLLAREKRAKNPAGKGRIENGS